VTVIGWGTQMGLWGYVILGEILEQDAIVAENGGPFSEGYWDRTVNDLYDAVIDRGHGWTRVPDWWALPHLPTSWRQQALSEADQ